MANAKTILNVGAGAGSYEPTDKYVVAVEPSIVMRAQTSASPFLCGEKTSTPAAPPTKQRSVN